MNKNILKFEDFVNENIGMSTRGGQRHYGHKGDTLDRTISSTAKYNILELGDEKTKINTEALKFLLDKHKKLISKKDKNTYILNDPKKKNILFFYCLSL